MQALVTQQKQPQVVDRPRPVPLPGEVIVKVMAAGLCRTDLAVGYGELACHDDRVLGHEGAGVICQLGQDVDGSRLGQPVAILPWVGCQECRYCREDTERLNHLCPRRKFVGRDRDGCFAEFIALPQHRCLPLPDGVSFQAGAYLEPLTAALGVLRAPVRDAKRLGVMGDNRIARLTRLVLTEVAQCAVQEVDPQENDSYDLLIETSPQAETIEQALRLLKPDGVLVLKSRPAGSVAWPVRLQVEKEITTIAVGYGSLTMARMLLKNRASLWAPLWRDPVPLSEWSSWFEAERDGFEELKTFFLPGAP